MLTKDDKQFIVGAIGGAIKDNNVVLRKEMRDAFSENNVVLRKEMKSEIKDAMVENNIVTAKNTKDAISENNISIFEMFNHLDQKMDRMEKNLKSEIRHNGVLIEQNADSIQLLGEGHSVINSRLSRLENNMNTVKENTVDLPVISKMVKSHHRKLQMIT